MCEGRGLPELRPAPAPEEAVHLGLTGKQAQAGHAKWNLQDEASWIFHEQAQEGDETW